MYTYLIFHHTVYFHTSRVMHNFHMIPLDHWDNWNRISKTFLPLKLGRYHVRAALTRLAQSNGTAALSSLDVCSSGWISKFFEQQISVHWGTICSSKKKHSAKTQRDTILDDIQLPKSPFFRCVGVINFSKKGSALRDGWKRDDLLSWYKKTRTTYTHTHTVVTVDFMMPI